MNENVENLVLEQLKGLRPDMAEMRREMNDRMDTLEIGQQSIQGVVMGLGHYMNALDHRVEALEKKIGGSE
ncbi:MAG: hypothetical protein ACU0BF_12235 [Paracoccaceae bacterium]